jgi:hypothetical protein
LTVNFAFIVVLVAAVSGLASEVALRAVAPDLGPALALALMAVGLLVAAWGRGRESSRHSSVESSRSTSPAG